MAVLHGAAAPDTAGAVAEMTLAASLKTLSAALAAPVMAIVGAIRNAIK
jgi:hypothetical protein